MTRYTFHPDDGERAIHDAKLKPGDRVHMAGEWKGGVKIPASGSPGNPIVFSIDSLDAAGDQFGFRGLENGQTDHIRIDHFNVHGAAKNGIDPFGGSFWEIGSRTPPALTNDAYGYATNCGGAGVKLNGYGHLVNSVATWGNRIGISSYKADSVRLTSCRSFENRGHENSDAFNFALSDGLVLVDCHGEGGPTGGSADVFQFAGCTGFVVTHCTGSGAQNANFITTLAEGRDSWGTFQACTSIGGKHGICIMARGLTTRVQGCTIVNERESCVSLSKHESGRVVVRDNLLVHPLKRWLRGIDARQNYFLTKSQAA